MSDPGIQEKFFPVKFSVRKLCDINNLNYVDVLLAIGAQVFVQYTESGGRLPNDLLKELETWKGRRELLLTTQCETASQGRSKGKGFNWLHHDAELRSRTDGGVPH